MNLSAEDTALLENEIRKAKPKSVLLQAPEGLKTSVQNIADKIRSFGPDCIIWADPCFGACDIPEGAAKALGCDLIVHVGHAPFMKPGRIPVLFIEGRSEADFVPMLKAEIHKIPHAKIGLVATIQHVGEIPKVKLALESAGKIMAVGKSPRLKYAGQVLGCDAEAAAAIEGKVDCFILLSGGKFHALGVAKKVSKPVFVADVDSGRIENMEGEKRLLEKKRILKLELFKDAKSVGILVSTKAGQAFLGAKALHENLESLGKKVWIVAMDYISPEKLLGMKFDILVNTACPRIEDDLVFGVPVIDRAEVRASLTRRREALQ